MDKKRLILFLIILTLISSCLPQFGPEVHIDSFECYGYESKNKIKGDINLDGRTDFNDLGPIVLYILDEKLVKEPDNIEHVVNQNIIEIDNSIEKNNKILAHRLCGAGNGGYFLVFMNKARTNYLNLKKQYKYVLPISISDNGVSGHKI